MEGKLDRPRSVGGRSGLPKPVEASPELERARGGKKPVTSLEALASVNVPLVVGGD